MSNRNWIEAPISKDLLLVWKAKEDNGNHREMAVIIVMPACKSKSEDEI